MIPEFSVSAYALTFWTYSLSKFPSIISSSDMLQAYKTGFEVIKNKLFTKASSSSVASKVLAGLFASKWAFNLSITSYSNLAVLSPDLTNFIVFSILLSRTSKSAKISSKFIVSISLIGSTEPSTWTTFSSSKHLTTWTIAATSLMCDKNLFPNPSPLLAPLTNPAIS